MSCDLLAKFCQRRSSSTHSTSLMQDFWKFIPGTDEEKADSLLKLFGKIQEERVAAKLSCNPKIILQNKSREQFSDFLLIVKYNFKKLKINLLGTIISHFAELPSTEKVNYSWEKKKSHASATSTEEYARICMTDAIHTEPMPLHFAKILGVHDIKTLRLQDREKKISALTKTLFLTLDENPKWDIYKSDFFKEKFFIPFQLMLLQYAAVTENDRFSSWMEQILEWGKQHPNILENFIKNFKIYHLVNLSEEKLLQTSTNRKDNKSLFHASSFRDHLIQKTLDQILTYTNLPPTAKIMLQGELGEENTEAGEAKRQLICFYILILKKLFLNISPDSPYCKREILTIITNPSNNNISLQTQALNILDTLCSTDPKLNNSFTKEILTFVTYVFELDDSLKNRMTLDERSCVFEFIYYSRLRYEEIQPLINFIFENLPKSLRLQILKALSHKNLQKRNTRITYFQMIKSSFEDSVKLSSNSFKPEDNILNYLDRDDEAYTLFSDLLDFLYGRFFIELTEEGGELLYNRLKGSDDEERKIYKSELEKYGERLNEKFNSMKINIQEKRLEYFHMVFKSFAKTYTSNASVQELLNKWPSSFKKNNVNYKLIQELQNLFLIRLSIKDFICIFLYPIFLPHFLDYLSFFLRVQKKINESKTSLILPSNLPKLIQSNIINMQFGEDIITSSHLPGEHGATINLSLLNIINLLQTALLPSSYAEPIILSSQGPIPGNQLFPLELQPSFCVLNWDKEATKYPILELSFINSMQNIESQSLSLPLELDKNHFNHSELWPLIETGLRELCQEIIDSECGELSLESLSPNEVLEHCLSIWPNFKKAYDRYLQQEKNSEEAKKVALTILKFVERVKIFSRTTLFQFHVPKNRKNSQKDLAAETPVPGSIFVPPEGLCLISSQNSEKNCQINKKEFAESIAKLCLTFSSTQNHTIFDPFCQLNIDEKNYPVKLKVIRHDLKQHTIPSFRRIYYELEFTLMTTPPCVYPLVLPENNAKDYEENPNLDDYSKLKGFKSQRELENFLLWVLTSLMKKYLNSQEK